MTKETNLSPEPNSDFLAVVDKVGTNAADMMEMLIRGGMSKPAALREAGGLFTGIGKLLTDAAAKLDDKNKRERWP